MLQGQKKLMQLASRRGLLARGFAARSAPLRGQSTDDVTMGERAAVRTNKMLDKIGGMYVSKNVGYSRKYADSYDKIFGKQSQAADEDVRLDGTPDVLETNFRDIDFPQGPLGLEIQWTAPPVVAAVIAGGAGEAADIKEGQMLLQMNGQDVTEPMPELELDHLIQQRPLRLRVTADIKEEDQDPALPSPARTVQRLGYAKVPGALSRKTSAELLDFMRLERRRCIAAVQSNPALAADFFSNVQTPKAGDGAPMTRWDMRFPVEPTVYNALQEMLGGSLGESFEDLAGGRSAELWELGVVVSEPGAAPQPVHFDAPEKCLFTAFVALQDITYEMGPTHFLPGTNTGIAHRGFEADPRSFMEGLRPAAPLLSAGDATIYDSRVLHCGGQNASDTTRALLYITFRHPDVDAKMLGIDQHSIRAALKGRFRLRHFR